MKEKKYPIRLNSWFMIIAIITFFACTVLISNHKIKAMPESENHEYFAAFDGELPDNGYSFIFFYEEECSLSKKMRYNLEQLCMDDENSIAYYEVEVNRFPHHCNAFEVLGTPGILIYEGKEEVSRIMGIVSQNNLKRIQHKLTQ